jgi:gliding motility-associated-like protein
VGIPNAFSPDGDGINEYWEISRLSLYPEAEVVILNRWGEMVWKSERGYPDPWDGRASNGRELPMDSYHYAIDLHNGDKPIVGHVTIIR